MPRNGSNIYSKPAGTTAIASTTIESAKYNSTIDDLVTDANTVRPIVAGGTAASTAAGALVNLGLTSLAADLNLLAGQAAGGLTGTELGYVNGVTSAIQTQINAKQPLDADLTAIAALTSAADKGITATGPGTWALHDQTAFARTLLAQADAAGSRSTLGAPAEPQSAGGAGQWTKVEGVAAASIATPAGGTWAYFGILTNSGVVSGYLVGVAAGGTTIYAGAANIIATSLVWRVR